MNFNHIAQCTVEIINNWFKKSKILSILELDKLDFFGLVQGMNGKMKTISSKVDVEHRVKSPGYIITNKQSRQIMPVNPGDGTVFMPNIAN